MSKRIEIDGKFYRKRRGVLVEIPAEWAGKTTFEQQKRGRRSHVIHKRRKDDGWKPPARLRPAKKETAE